MEEAIVCSSTFAVGRDAISAYVATPSLSRSVAVAGSRADYRSLFSSFPCSMNTFLLSGEVWMKTASKKGR